MVLESTQHAMRKSFSFHSFRTAGRARFFSVVAVVVELNYWEWLGMDLMRTETNDKYEDE